MSWYEAYDERHGGDGAEGRLVALYRFEEPWTSWEMHPAGDEVVCCIQGHMTLHQELPDGSAESIDLGPGDYAVNPPCPGHRGARKDPLVPFLTPAGRNPPHRPG